MSMGDILDRMPISDKAFITFSQFASLYSSEFGFTLRFYSDFTLPTWFYMAAASTVPSIKSLSKLITSFGVRGCIEA